jgi:two-component system sensor histidine kinase YesM
MSNLNQIELSLQNTLTNLNHVSQQMSSQGSVGMKLEEYLTADEPYRQSKLISEIKSEMGLITFTNPGIGLAMYYFQKDHTVLFENSSLKSDYSIEKLPVFAQYYKISYFGPHKSIDRMSNQYVLSILRKVELADRDDVYIYIESGFNFTKNILDSDKAAGKATHLILDNNGRITYSENQVDFPLESIFTGFSLKKMSGELEGYQWFRATSNQGWSVVSIISKREYYKERDQWISQLLLLLVVFLPVSILLAVLLWKMVYKPLNNFNREINWIVKGDFQSKTTKTKIPEFDYLLDKFQNMKQQIMALFKEVESKEKRRADLEIEKLRYQINPHFLMNTVNTVHWLAVTNNQPEIDKVALALNKLLYYNIGKKGSTTTIVEEIDALREYMHLQQIRYDFQYRVNIPEDDRLGSISIPGFILQPVVENALFHGLDGNGLIEIDVKLEDHLIVTIADNGRGMPEETISKLLNNERADREKVGMGIGLNYVKRILNTYYNGGEKLEIQSGLGSGTRIVLTLPLQKEESHD